MAFPIICLLLIWSFYPFPPNDEMTVFSFLVLSVEHDRKYQNIGIDFQNYICSQNIFLLQSKAFSKSHCTQQNACTVHNYQWFKMACLYYIHIPKLCRLCIIDNIRLFFVFLFLIKRKPSNDTRWHEAKILVSLV